MSIAASFSQQSIASELSRNSSAYDALMTSSGNPIYCALYDFLQTSQPRVVWRYGEMTESDENDFMWYILSVPSVVESADILPKPTFVTSSFDNYSYTAFYASIPDIEARGFSRSICLVVASQKQESIQIVNSLFIDQFTEIIDEARMHSASLFYSEIDFHIQALTDFLAPIEKLDSHQTQLKIKLDRLTEIRNNFPVDVPTISIIKERCSKNAILFINNDIREIEFIIDWSILQNKVLAILKSFIIPNPVLMGQLLTPSSFPQVYVPSLTFPEERSLHFLYKAGILKHCIFSILSGRTLVLSACASVEEIRSLALALVELCPFRWDNDVQIQDHPPNQSDINGKIVVAVPDTIQPPNLDNISLVEFGRKTVYKGKLCPDSSFVAKLPGPEKDRGEGTFWLRLQYLIAAARERHSRFRLFHLARTPRGRSEILQLMEASGMSREDGPIFDFWTTAAQATAKPEEIGQVREGTVSYP